MSPENLESGPLVATERRLVRFSLSDLVSFIVLWSVVLGLISQLRHIGFWASGFVIGTAAGWRFRNQRLMAASFTGLFVFVANYLAFWVGLNTAPSMNIRQYVGSGRKLDAVGRILERYFEINGEYPDSLSDSLRVDDFEVDPSLITDYGGRSFHYRKRESGYELASLGRDGKLGGVGMDMDIYLEDWKRPDQGSGLAKSRLPLSQFLFEAPGRTVINQIALLTSLVASSIWFCTPCTDRITTGGLFVGAATTAWAAAIVATFLAIVHLSFQLGH